MYYDNQHLKQVKNRRQYFRMTGLLFKFYESIILLVFNGVQYLHPVCSIRIKIQFSYGSQRKVRIYSV